MSSVELYMYDLSDGWCKNIGPLCPVKAIWHTSIVVYGREYVFGNNGITFHAPGKPSKILELGITNIKEYDFKIHVKELKYSTWKASSYDLFNHNCNHFTDYIAKYLGVGGIPQYVFDSLQKLRESPFYAKIIDWVIKNSQHQNMLEK